MSLESESSKKPILLLVDGHSLAFRSYYAYSRSFEILVTANLKLKSEIKEGLAGELIIENPDEKKFMFFIWVVVHMRKVVIQLL